AVDRRVRHALDLRGRVPVDARDRDEPAPRPSCRIGRRRPAAAAHERHARGDALLRARDRGARTASRRRRRRARLGRGGSAMNVRAKIVEWVPAIVVFCLGIVVWQVSIDIFDIQKFLLPKPGSIVSAFFTQRHTLWSAGWLTLKEALGGFAIGSGLGIVFAMI